MEKIWQKFGLDWGLLLATLPLVLAGLVTMNSFGGGENIFFERQIIWVSIGYIVMILASFVDWRFLRKRGTVLGLFGFSVALLLILFVIGSVFQGAQSWFDFGYFAFQPSDPIKLIIIIVLAKYFSKRYANWSPRHILVSGLYVFLIALLVFLQPDFGSAIIIILIWLGMIVAAGAPIRHLLVLGLVAVLSVSTLWFFGFEDYQKDRLVSFLNPLTDITGAGYNAYQSTVAVGSGEIFGKGVGQGTQSRLEFLPEFQTDFIFAAFAEEWGFMGVLILFSLFGVLIWRVLSLARRGNSNFEMLFGTGVATLFIAHFVVHVGMNIGVLPITGTTIPFLSYGGSHLVSEFLALGILMGMSRYGRVVHPSEAEHEFIGVE